VKRFAKSVGFPDVGLPPQELIGEPRESINMIRVYHWQAEPSGREWQKVERTETSGKRDREKSIVLTKEIISASRIWGHDSLAG
jgi:hypothetical protein